MLTLKIQCSVYRFIVKRCLFYTDWSNYSGKKEQRLLYDF